MAKRSGPQIALTMILWKQDGRFDMICLQTNIAVSANSEHEANAKMRDASVLYLGSFSREEIESKKYKRPAPLKYQVLSLIGLVIHNWRKLKRADYDQAENSLKFA